MSRFTPQVEPRRWLAASSASLSPAPFCDVPGSHPRPAAIPEHRHERAHEPPEPPSVFQVPSAARANTVRRRSTRYDQSLFAALHTAASALRRRLRFALMNRLSSFTGGVFNFRSGVGPSIAIQYHGYHANPIAICEMHYCPFVRQCSRQAASSFGGRSQTSDPCHAIGAHQPAMPRGFTARKHLRQ